MWELAGIRLAGCIGGARWRASLRPDQAWLPCSDRSASEAVVVPGSRCHGAEAVRGSRQGMCRAHDELLDRL